VFIATASAELACVDGGRRGAPSLPIPCSGKTGGFFSKVRKLSDLAPLEIRELRVIRGAIPVPVFLLSSFPSPEICVIRENLWLFSSGSGSGASSRAGESGIQPPHSAKVQPSASAVSDCFAGGGLLSEPPCGEKDQA